MILDSISRLIVHELKGASLFVREKMILGIMVSLVCLMTGVAPANAQQRSDITPMERREIKLASGACLDDCSAGVEKTFEVAVKQTKKYVADSAFKKAVLWVTASARVATVAGIALKLITVSETASPEIDMRPKPPPAVSQPAPSNRGLGVTATCYKDGREVPCPIP